MHVVYRSGFSRLLAKRVIAEQRVKLNPVRTMTDVVISLGPVSTICSCSGSFFIFLLALSDQNSEENIEGHGAITVNGSAIFHNSVLQPTSPSFDFW